MSKQSRRAARYRHKVTPDKGPRPNRKRPPEVVTRMLSRPEATNELRSLINGKQHYLVQLPTDLTQWPNLDGLSSCYYFDDAVGQVLAIQNPEHVGVQALAVLAARSHVVASVPKTEQKLWARIGAEPDERDIIILDTGVTLEIQPLLHAAAS